MDKEEQIRNSIKRLMKPVTTILAQVLSVDMEERTCDVMDDDTRINDVRLRPVINGKESITFFPKVGSWVLIARIELEEDFMVLATDEVDKIRLVAGDTEIELKDGIMLKRDNETLKQVISDLIVEIQRITVPTNAGPSGTPLNSTQFGDINTRVNNLLK